ncbi:MAG TPA: hypothetical protein VGE08_08490 [Steroidobacter sp.]|uniref:hypothetical protein n=1 Tax=Steroidobacter sp. TaxID=1978227 RepID=UPI002EDA3075
MRVCIKLFRVPASVEVEESIFTLMELLEDHCDSISACEVFVEGSRGDRACPARCTVRLALQVFGEQVYVTGMSSPSSDDPPLQSALNNTYRDAVTALEAVARAHQGCSCHGSLKRERKAADTVAESSRLTIVPAG